MKNFVQDGETLPLVAPHDVLSGDGFRVGAIFAIASADALAGSPVEGAAEGVYILPKTTAQAWTQGARIYWDDTNKRCDNNGSVGMLIGTATAAAANPSPSGTVLINCCAPGGLTGAQPAIADIATADAADLASAEALANANKVTLNALLAALRLVGVIAA